MNTGKIIKIRNFVAVLTMVLCIVLFICMGINGKLNIYAPRGMGAVDSDEYMTITNYQETVVEDVNSPIGKTKEYRFNIPYTISMDNSIMFYIYHHEVEVYIGDEVAYRLSLDKSSGIGKSPTCEWVCIPVSKNDMGQNVLIKLKPVYKAVANSNFDFFYGNEGVIFSKVVKKEAPHLLIAAICLFLGIMIILAKSLLHKKVNYYPKETTYLGVLAILLGIWKIFDSEVAPMIMNINPVILGYIPLVVLFICMIPITAFVGYRFKENNSTHFNTISLVLWMLPSLVILAQLFNLSDLRENLYMAHMTMIAVTLMVAVKVIKEKKDAEPKYRFGNPLLLFLGLGAIVDVILFYANHVATGMIFTMVGFLIYTLGMFVELIFGAIDDGKRLENLVEERTKELKDSLERAEAGARAKSNFLFNMSHDIRTPMNAVLGFNELAKENIDHKEKVLDALEKAQFSGEYMVSIINDILDMSLIESGNLKLNRDLIDIEDLLEKIKELFNKESDKRNVALEICSNAEPRMVYGDVVRITQVFTNLIGNAFKFTPSGGKVTVTVEDEVLMDNKVKYTVHVKDTGIGMSSEFKENIFNAFEREKSATESGVQGTGLGLAIVKNIIDLMKGEITVQSEVGQGTDFCIKLEAEIVDNIFSRDEKQESSLECSSIRILLVEDNMLNREIAKELLTIEGFHVEEAENGKVALELVETHQANYYDLVLMDIQMPVMDGYEAAKAIRSLENSALAQIPIVAMTANTFAEDRQKSLESGMNEHISKPVDKKTMLEIIKKVIQ